MPPVKTMKNPIGTGFRHMNTLDSDGVLAPTSGIKKNRSDFIAS